MIKRVGCPRSFSRRGLVWTWVLTAGLSLGPLTRSASAQEVGLLPTQLAYEVRTFSGIPPTPTNARDDGEQNAQGVQDQRSDLKTQHSRTEGRDVSWKKLPGNILHDQKDIWLFPTQLARGRHWLPTIAVVGVTAGLIAADPHDMRYFRRTDDFNDFSSALSGRNTGIVEAAVPGALYLGGLIFHDSYASKTALLAGEAYVDSAIPHVAIKLASRRLRPINVAAKHDLSGTFFQSHVSVFGKGSSFPSGHAAGAFSIATVIARRYRDHRWVPWLAYAAAAAVSFSRVPTLAHFPSDAFLGAALGYTTARYAVLRGE